MIDLHAHSCFSDGTDTPEDLARLGEEAGLTALALTDHDTVAGVPRFLALQPHLNVLLIPGIELGCRFLGRELHVLGFWVRPDDPTFLDRLTLLRTRRERRNVRMAERLAATGRTIDLEEVREAAPGGLVTRTHFAQVLVRRGHARSPREAFHRFLAEGAPAHVPMEELTPREAATWIREAGGVPAIAHPGRFAAGAFVWDRALADLRDQGLEGLEAYYGEHSRVQEASFLDLARRLDMVPCGGSDYHGSAKPGLQLGRGWGSLHVPDGVLAELERRRPPNPR